MKSWKTTVMGLITAVAVAVYPSIEQGEINWKAVALAALIAIMGYLAKDHDVSGV